MKNIFDVVKHNPLWNGINYGDFESLINCMEGKIKNYGKGDIVLLSGGKVSRIGMIISGSVRIIKEDADGNVTMLAELGVSELFGEVFVCAGIGVSPVTVQASEKCGILFINYAKIINSCSSSCSFHTKLIENMLKLIARKNLLLNQKIEILSKRTTRKKLLAFFDAERGSLKKFTVPYNREETADYLCVDRSALSNELCKMRDEGLIKFKKNRFEILSGEFFD